MVSRIEDRLRASVRFDTINGDVTERSICANQMLEAAAEIERLRQYIEARERWYPIRDADFDAESLNLVLWEDKYVTMEDFCHDDTAEWWEQRGAVLFRPVDLPISTEEIG